MNKYQAYLLGAFLTDGCISNKKGWNYFTLEVIDEDFADKVILCINNLTEQKGHKYIRNIGGRVMYKAYCGDQQLCKWLLACTDSKTRLPLQIYDSSKDIQKEFIMGMMDGDGYISQYKQGWLGVMGFAVTDLWVFEFCTLLNRLGVQTSKPKPETKGRSKTLYRFRINKPSYIAAGLDFGISRKKARLDKLRSPETTRETPGTGEDIVHTR